LQFLDFFLHINNLRFEFKKVSLIELQKVSIFSLFPQNHVLILIKVALEIMLLNELIKFPERRIYNNTNKLSTGL